MNWIITTILAGMTAFAATNIDDIVLLTLFFARVDETLRRRHIVAGQYLGFLGLIVASLPGFLGGMIIPKVWLGWLGLLPIAIGIHSLVLPETDQTTLQVTALPQRQFASILSPQTYQVAAVTLANGGDNIGIYIPLFANSNLAELAITLAVFLVMIGVWCGISDQLARQPLLSRALSRYGHRLVPFVLIGLGIFILIDSGTYRLLI
jgi:cadmium resistance transport/sequestration family protein